jgi:hypothetical protein
MGVHKRCLTDQDFMRAMHFITKFGEEAQLDPAYHVDLVTAHVAARAMERLAEAVNNVAKAICDKSPPEKEIVLRKAYRENPKNY